MNRVMHEERVNKVQAYMKEHNCFASEACEAVGVVMSAYFSSKKTLLKADGIVPKRGRPAGISPLQKTMTIEAEPTQSFKSSPKVVCLIGDMREILGALRL